MKTQLETLVLKMYRSGITYTEAVAEFKKTFIETALKEADGHQVNAARNLRRHRISLARLISELQLDARDFRRARRRPPNSERLPSLTSKSS